MRTNRRKMIRQSILPVSYERLNYIENTSTAYIDCGLQPKYTFNYEIKSDVFTNNLKLFLLGCIFFSDGSDYRFFSNFTSYNKHFNFYLDVGNKRISVSAPSSPNFIYHVKFGNYYINTVNPKDYKATGDIFDETINNAKLSNLFLFWDNKNPSTVSIGKIYFLKIKDKSKLIRDFIPVKRKSDGIIGLYDLVGRMFYTSPNGVAFTGG